jgi:hypothetical protein
MVYKKILSVTSRQSNRTIWERRLLARLSIFVPRQLRVASIRAALGTSMTELFGRFFFSYLLAASSVLAVFYAFALAWLA